ncbi:MAG TPA: M50 family metallopeptidase, partial [Verrucomicrobiae bacterium]|nr:M50 family metallopeptidase [Verrucomicrobiae bacterium]
APAEISRIDSMYTNSPAALAGLKQGDDILEINGVKMYSPAAVEDYIEDNGTKPVQLVIDRKGKRMTINVTPEIPLGSVTNKANIGVNTWDVPPSHLVHPEPVTQVTSSLDAMFSTFGALFDRKSDIKPQHLGGAVKILSVYYMLFQDEDGWRLALWFSVLMNVNLALLNMLPFPVLDGGHIALALVETVRRKPVSARILGYLQTTCAMVLIGYMLYIAFFDVQDLIPRGKEPVELKFAPKNEPAK